jgi:proteasome lid subunit RPN8/RPN11
MPTAPVAYEAAARRPVHYESRVREVLSTLGSTNPDEDIASTGSLLENSKRAKMDPAAAAGIIYATSRHRHPPTSVLRSESASEAYKRVTEYYRRPKGGGSRKQEWMRAFSDEVKRLRPDVYTKIDWDTAHHLYNEGMDPVEAARKVYGETAAEDSSPAPCTKPARTVSDECQRIAKEIGPIRSDKELYALVAPQMRKEPQEVFYVVSCDVHGNLVGFTEVARGQVSRVAVDVEDVLGAVLAVRPRPTIFYICHCHPSGKARPSEADEKLTEAIRHAAKVAMPNVVLGDHLIVGGGSSREYYSFSDKRLKKA